jgi:glycosyltransferase involved in cell wall biosynthesis
VPGETGCLVPLDNPRAFAQAIVSLLQDAEQRRRMGEAARARALARFDARRMVARFEHVLDETRIGAPRSASQPFL